MLLINTLVHAQLLATPVGLSRFAAAVVQHRSTLAKQTNLLETGCTLDVLFEVNYALVNDNYCNTGDAPAECTRT
jgi:hypothetical protein